MIELDNCVLLESTALLVLLSGSLGILKAVTQPFSAST